MKSTTKHISILLICLSLICVVGSVSASNCENCNQGYSVETTSNGFIVSFDTISPGSTGYYWNANYDSSVLELISSEFVSDNCLPGSPGHMVFTFKTVGELPSTVEFTQTTPSGDMVNNFIATLPDNRN